MADADDSGHGRGAGSEIAEGAGLGGAAAGGCGPGSGVAGGDGLAARAADGDGFVGPAELAIAGVTFAVLAELRGYFEPIDGRYHWYGRLARHESLRAAMTSGRADAVLSTREGSARCEVADPDAWWRYRVAGVGSPPFRSELRRPPVNLRFNPSTARQGEVKT